MVKQQQPPPSDADVLPTPRRWYDADWRERIEIAKKEREAAQKAREGKPATFSRRRG
jgi:hypothetical protein